jgi:hypothetical protein
MARKNDMFIKVVIWVIVATMVLTLVTVLLPSLS